MDRLYLDCISERGVSVEHLWGLINIAILIATHQITEYRLTYHTDPDDNAYTSDIE